MNEEFEEVKARDIMDKAEAILQFFGEDATNMDVAMTLAYATARMMVCQFSYFKEVEDPTTYEMLKNGVQAQYLAMLKGFIDKMENRLVKEEDE